MFQQGHMERGVNPHMAREFDNSWVTDVPNLKRIDVPGCEFPGGDL